MGPVQGKNGIIYFSDGGAFKEFGCAEAFSLELTDEVVEITTVSHGAYKAFDYANAKTHSINLSGITQVEDVSNWTVWEFEALHRNSITFLYRIIYTDDGGQSKTVSGRCLIPRLMIDAAQADLSTSTISLQGTGAYLVSDGVTTDVEVTLTAAEFSGINGSIDSAELDDGNGNIYDLLPGGPLVGTAFPGTSTTATVPSGVYILRITVTIAVGGPGNSLAHDAAPGDTQFPSSGTTSFYPGADPFWDFTSNRTITLTTGGV